MTANGVEESAGAAETQPPSPAVTLPAIELRDVRKEFALDDGTVVSALRGIDLAVAEGEFCCVLGPSGHGKSTTLNLIAGFDKPSSGSVTTFGKEVTGPGPDRGVVFQRDALFLWKRVRDNIGFGLKARGVPKEQRQGIVQRYLGLIGLEDRGNAWPKQLSGGMRRRVAIAAVFANEPKVLLMDEPFVGLDYARRADLHEVLLELWGRSNSTVFFVTHDLDEALALGDRIVVVLHGEVVLDVRLTMPRPRTVDALSSDEAIEVRREVLSRMQLGTGTA
jgi:NitT/TauT family transport system ATP-binding protein